MQPKIVKSAVLQQTARKGYLVVLNETYWDFWDARTCFYFDDILGNPTSICDIVPVGKNADEDAFTVYKFFVGLN